MNIGDDEVESLRKQVDILERGMQWVYGTYASDKYHDKEMSKQNYINLLRTIQEANDALKQLEKERNDYAKRNDGRNN